jgi:hypothetical protein
MSIGNVNFELKAGSYVTLRGNDDGTMTVKIVDDGEGGTVRKREDYREKRKECTFDPGYAIYTPQKKSDTNIKLSTREIEDLNKLCSTEIGRDAYASIVERVKPTDDGSYALDISEKEHKKKEKKKAVNKRKPIVSKANFEQGMQMRQENNLKSSEAAELLDMNHSAFLERKKRYVADALSKLNIDDFSKRGISFKETYYKARSLYLMDMDICIGAGIDAAVFKRNKQESLSKSELEAVNDNSLYQLLKGAKA